MKIDFSQVLVGLNGKALQTADSADATKTAPLTLGTVCTEALMSVNKETRTPGITKIIAYRLAQRIYDQGEVEITPEEATMLRSMIEEGWPVAVVGPAHMALDPK